MIKNLYLLIMKTKCLYFVSRSKEPVHMTLQEVRQYLQNLYSSSSDSMERRSELLPRVLARSRPSSEPKMPAPPPPIVLRTTPTPQKKANFISTIKMKKSKSVESREDKAARKCTSFSNSIKQTLCSIFKFRKVGAGHDTDKVCAIISLLGRIVIYL